MASILRRLRRFIALIRAREWWDSKLPFALGVAYALAWHLRLPLYDLWERLLLLLAAGITSAVYASVFNDLIDQDEDRLAGKVTGIISLSRCGKASVLAVTLAGIVCVAGLLHRFPVALLCYAAIVVNYTLYSLPPFRWKTRGVWGALSIAVGEHLLAALLAVSLVGSAAGCPVPPLWLAAVGVWSVAFGLRSILWHQLCDSENDRASQTRTLGARYDPRVLRRLGEWGVFPLELGSFGVLLFLSHSLIAWVLLVCYLVMEWLRRRFLGMNIVVVAPRPHFRFALLEYYQLFFPIAFLLEFVRRDPSALLLLAIQLLAFPAPAWVLVSHIGHLLRWRLWISFCTWRQSKDTVSL